MAGNSSCMSLNASVNAAEACRSCIRSCIDNSFSILSTSTSGFVAARSMTASTEAVPLSWRVISFAIFDPAGIPPGAVLEWEPWITRHGVASVIAGAWGLTYSDRCRPDTGRGMGRQGKSCDPSPTHQDEDGCKEAASDESGNQAQSPASHERSGVAGIGCAFELTTGDTFGAFPCAFYGGAFLGAHGGVSVPAQLCVTGAHDSPPLMPM